MKLQFIVNPASKTGRGIEIWHEVETVLKSTGVEYEVFFTKRIGHGTELAKKMTEGPGEHMLVALGGDGTVNEVARGIGDSGKTLGIVPCGSGDGLALCLGISRNYKRAINTILNGRVSYIDTGKINSSILYEIISEKFM